MMAMHPMILKALSSIVQDCYGSVISNTRSRKWRCIQATFGRRKGMCASRHPFITVYRPPLTTPA